MKYIVVLGDGMADYPVEELGGKTPLKAAFKPNMDAMAGAGTLGLVKTIPDGLPAGSDTANLSVLGYDPRKYYSGRSPLEAASMGIELKENDVAFRCNFVTFSEEGIYEDKTMLDHSAGEITSEEAEILLQEVNRHFADDKIRFYPGVGYRHLLVWNGAPEKWSLTPPHDILGRPVAGYLPSGQEADTVLSMMRRSAEFLSRHPVNRERIARGLSPANSIWIWGEGKKPQLPSFSNKYGLRGGVISAVDLIRGIGICAGMEVLEVPGATGNLQTNFNGKAEKAVAALKAGLDFVYIHIEAPDECGHKQERDNKIKAIELIDKLVVATLREQLALLREPYRMMILPDHATPLALRTHTADPVPFLIYDSISQAARNSRGFNEEEARRTGIYIDEGHTLLGRFLARDTGGI